MSAKIFPAEYVKKYQERLKILHEQRGKIWAAGEILTAADLNREFATIRSCLLPVETPKIPSQYQYDYQENTSQYRWYHPFAWFSFNT
jgi:hypothetical protein